jgi:Fe-S-cluster containining protein
MKQQFERDDLKPGEVLCEYCTGKCCRYFALPMETPTDWEDFDHIRWYMMHGDVSIFVDSGSWYLMVHADCKHLLPNNFCGAYETRPEICRAYTTDECEFDNDAIHEQLFETPEQIWEYAHAVLPARPRRTESDPISLPVLSVV